MRATRGDRADEFSHFAELRTPCRRRPWCLCRSNEKAWAASCRQAGAESIFQHSVLVALQPEQLPPAVFRPDRARPYRRSRKFPDDLELEDRVEYERGQRDRSPLLAIFQRGKA